MLLGLGLRVALCASFQPAPRSWVKLGSILGEGLLRDVAVSAVALTPLWLMLCLARARWLERTAWRGLFLCAFASSVAFACFTEYFFFEEFSARFNRVAVDYVLFPHEVLGNLRESYDVVSYVALSVGLGMVLGSALTLATRGVRRPARPVRARVERAAQSAALIGLAGILCVGAPDSPQVDRVERELAANGLASLWQAVLVSGIDYSSYYMTLATADADARAARIFGAKVGRDASGRPELVKHGSARERSRAEPLDVVVILEESLGSEFSQRFGAARVPSTPHLDRWSHRGLALTQLIATGNRTVRGMESVLAGFLPLPGGALLQRDGSNEVLTLARVFERLGYRTRFFYGGYGIFDGLKKFACANGYQEFIERPDLPSEAFKTIWGVADEYLFDALLDSQLQARERGERLFATALTVSNHKPYAIPPGRIDWPAGKRKRRGAVLYADWALGRYLDRAQAEGILEHTLVLIVGDHGARVYGSATIPTASYRVPALILTPEDRWRDTTIDRLCSQVDLPPTLLELCGLECRAPFLGQCVLGLSSTGGRAFVSHNYDVGILCDDGLVVFSLHRRSTLYRRRDRTSDTFEIVERGRAPAGLLELERDGAAAFQFCSELYEAGGYRLRGDALASTSISG